MSIQNLEAEQTVLGSLLLDGELVKECRLKPQHFSNPVYQAVFKVMRQVEEDGDPLDLVSLVSKMDSSFLQQIGGVGYFVTIMDSVPTTANFLHYEALVRDARKRRQAHSLMQHMEKRLLEEKDNKVIGELIAKLSELEEAEPLHECELPNHLVTLYNNLQIDTGSLTGIETGFSALNQITCGLQEEDFVIIGARPSMGKTAFAINLAFHAAKAGTAVGIFSLEMSTQQVLKRFTSCAGKISGNKLKNAKHRFNMDDWAKFNMILPEISELPLEIHDKAGITTQDIWIQARKMKRKHPDKKLLVIIDYLQLITGDEKHRGNRFQEMSDISRKLKLMARDLNICVVALSQLSRAVESRNDKRPLLSDLRETGQIEQDADVIMLMYRDDYYDKDTAQEGITEIHVAKHRNGPIGTVKLLFEKEYGRFVERR